MYLVSVNSSTYVCRQYNLLGFNHCCPPILPILWEKIDHQQKRLFSPKIRQNRRKAIITGVARFYMAHDPKTGKMYQMRINCTKWS
jgi:hypothetical protein